MQITENIRSFIYHARRRGRSCEVIAEALVDFSGEDFTAGDVKMIWQTMVETGWVSKKRARSKRDSALPSSSEPIFDRLDLMKRSIYHLVDLKRAGHSPTRTEYVISAEGRGVRYRTADTCSYVGSSMASCAEEV